MLLQSISSTVNVVFINIDWKKTRHINATALSRNMKKLRTTIRDVVGKMKPAMICLSEVGEASNLLAKEHMQQVAETTKQSWREAATEHGELCSMFEVSGPYMTVYDGSKVQCSHHRILTNLYQARGEPRTAQLKVQCTDHRILTDLSTIYESLAWPVCVRNLT